MTDGQPLSLHTLPKVTTRKKKRVGRGYGSGRGGHTAGRGTKGQKSRSQVKWWFEGGQLPLVHRLPFQRGKGRLQSLKPKPIIIKTGQLNQFRAGATVNLKSLIKQKLVSEKEARTRGIKILVGGNKLTKKLKVSNLPASQAAAKIIASTTK